MNLTTLIPNRLVRLVPDRLRHQSRVVAIMCRYCGQWRKPRHIRMPATVCRACETTPVFQSWKRQTSIPTVDDFRPTNPKRRQQRREGP